MLTEMLGKGGSVCSLVRSGEVQCPLIVRPTSEDVITGHVFQSLGYLNPRWWMPDFLNTALGTARFRRQVFRRLRIRLWQNQPCYPAELLPWAEGSTQVDAIITFENPPTTIFIEAKFRSGFSRRVSGDDGQSGYPSDQIIRNFRVGLHSCGYFDSGDRLFKQPPRDFILVVLSPLKGHSLVRRYRDPKQLRAAIPHSDRLVGLPRGPFLGELSYEDLVGVLRSQARWMSRSERQVIDALTNYLEFKRDNLPARSARPASSATSEPTNLGGLPEPLMTETRPSSQLLEILSVD